MKLEKSDEVIDRPIPEPPAGPQCHGRRLGVGSREARDVDADISLAGDMRQKIYDRVCTLRGCGINIAGGRARILRVNYRTAQSVYQAAKRVLGGDVSDIDGAALKDDDVYSPYSSNEEPVFRRYDTEDEELAAMADKIRELAADAEASVKVGVLVRSHRAMDKAGAFLKEAGIPCVTDRALRSMDEKGAAPMEDALVGKDKKGNQMVLMTMHEAKGITLDYAFVPGITQAQLEEALGKGSTPARERRLLYVALSRARFMEYPSCYGEPSELMEPYNRKE